jgi:hypothetical protein
MSSRDFQVKKLFAILRHADLNRDKRLALFSAILHEPVETTSDLNEIQIRAIVDVVDYWNRIGELKTRCASMIAAERRRTHIDPGDGQTAHDAQEPTAVPGPNPPVEARQDAPSQTAPAPTGPDDKAWW